MNLVAIEKDVGSIIVLEIAFEYVYVFSSEARVYARDKFKLRLEHAEGRKSADTHTHTHTNIYTLLEIIIYETTAQKSVVASLVR